VNQFQSPNCSPASRSARGILRGLTDFGYRTFVADLAVIRNYQNQGIGRGLLEEAQKSGPDARLVLFSAEDAEGFYQKLGFQLHE